MNEVIEFDVGNHYGALHAKKDGDKFYWCIENYDGMNWEEIPEALYMALVELGPRG